MMKLPIRPVSFSDPPDKMHHDEMVSLVEQEIKERGIRHVDTVIDHLVYELYGRSDKEIRS
jgi:hypothetical protein